ncbi:exported hypothetical protein [Gammaproteobacteria bacterium]
MNITKLVLLFATAAIFNLSAAYSAEPVSGQDPYYDQNSDVAAATAATKCGKKTLKGTYIYSSRGAPSAIASTTYVEAGMESYDGAGNIINRYASSNPSASGREIGTYTMGANCIGKITYTSGSTYMIFTGPTGSIFTYIKTSENGEIVSGEEKRVTGSLLLKSIPSAMQ